MVSDRTDQFLIGQPARRAREPIIATPLKKQRASIAFNKGKDWSLGSSRVASKHIEIQ